MDDSKIDLDDLDGFLEKIGKPDVRSIRFKMLSAYAYHCNAEKHFSPEEQCAFVAHIQTRIADWPAVSRKAKDEWWMDMRCEDSVYEYGYNNGGGADTFHGFLDQPSWLMPLARAADLSNPTIKLDGEHLNGFLQSPAISSLQVLRIAKRIGPEIVEGIVHSGRFDHLLVLETPYLSGLDKQQMKAFANWKRVHQIASSIQ